jgi:hypothetical protein
MVYNFSDYEPTYNKTIDLCANLIANARVNQMPLKALHLTPLYYEWYKSGVQTLLNRPLLDEELLQFDGVNIEKGSRYQTKSVILEYYNNKPVLN